METELRYVMDAVRTIRRELDGAVPLIGFSGSPWTLACYMVEGGGSKDWGRSAALALERTAAMHRLLTVVTDAVIATVRAARRRRAVALQVFDTWAAPPGPGDVPRILAVPHPGKASPARSGHRRAGDPVRQGNAPHLDDLFASGADAIGVDWTVTLKTPRAAPTAATCRATWTRRSCTAAGRDPWQVATTLDSYASGNGGSARGPCVQPRPRHVAGHGSRTRRGLVEAVHALSALSCARSPCAGKGVLVRSATEACR